MCPQIPLIAFIYIDLSNTLSSHTLCMKLAEKHCWCITQYYIVTSSLKLQSGFLKVKLKIRKKSWKQNSYFKKNNLRMEDSSNGIGKILKYSF